MFRTLLSHLKTRSKNDEIIMQRDFARRYNDACICVINDQAYPVENWSMGGMLIHADGQLFSVGRAIDITLKFRLQKGIMEITQRAHIVRKSKNKVALKFLSLTKQNNQKFQIILDDLIEGHSQAIQI